MPMFAHKISGFGNTSAHTALRCLIMGQCNQMETASQWSGAAAELPDKQRGAWSHAGSVPRVHEASPQRTRL